MKRVQVKTFCIYIYIYIYIYIIFLFTLQKTNNRSQEKIICSADFIYIELFTRII